MAKFVFSSAGAFTATNFKDQQVGKFVFMNRKDRAKSMKDLEDGKDAGSGAGSGAGPRLPASVSAALDVVEAAELKRPPKTDQQQYKTRIFAGITL
jgi:hypothetical protein